jgi:hypothetical protein
MDRDSRRASGLVQTTNKKSQNEDPNGSHGMRDETLIQRIRGGETDLFQECSIPNFVRFLEVEALLTSQQAPGRGESAYSQMSCGLHQPTEREYGLDNTLSETFPCSDPLSSIPNPTSQPL